MRIKLKQKIYKNIIFFFLTVFIIYLIYTFKFAIIINFLKLYNNISNNPNIERLIGESYYSLSHESQQSAQKHFEIALNKYLYLYQNSNHHPINDREYHLIEYIIGNSYEYAKGTKKNLYTAKSWYNKASNGGIQDAKIALDRVNSQIKNQNE